MQANNSSGWVNFQFTAEEKDLMTNACLKLGTSAQISEFIRSCEGQLSGYISTVVSGLSPQREVVTEELSRIFKACARVRQVLRMTSHSSRLEIEHAVIQNEFIKQNKPPDCLIEGMLLDLERVLDVRDSKLIKPLPEALRKSLPLRHIAWDFQRVFRVKASPSKSGRFMPVAVIASRALDRYSVRRLLTSETALKFAVKNLGNTEGCTTAPKVYR